MLDSRLSAISPRPPVCAHEPLVRDGLAAAARLVLGEYPEPGARECDLGALARALSLLAPGLVAGTCLAPQMIEREATIRGLVDRVVTLTSALRRSEAAIEDALRRNAGVGRCEGDCDRPRAAQ